MIFHILFEDNNNLIDFCSKMNNDNPPEEFKEITAMYYIDNTINTLEEFVNKIDSRLNVIKCTFYKDIGIVFWLNNENTICWAITIIVKDINQLVSENFQKAGYAEVFLEKVKASKGKNSIYTII